MLAARLAEGLPETGRNRVTIAALWLAVLCPFTANFTAVPLTEVLATLLTTLALLGIPMSVEQRPELLPRRLGALEQ